MIMFLLDATNKNVIFLFLDRPYASSQQSCIWEVNKTGTCNISFKSYPDAKFQSILFNGNLIRFCVCFMNFISFNITYVYFGHCEKSSNDIIYNFVAQELTSPIQMIQMILHHSHPNNPLFLSEKR